MISKWHINYESKEKLGKLISLIYMAIPALILSVKGIVSYCFFLLLLISFFLLRNTKTANFIILKEYRWFTIAMGFWPCVFLLQMFVMKMWNGTGFDLALRIAGSIPIFILLSRLPSTTLKNYIGWGTTIGSFGALGMALYTTLMLENPEFGNRAYSLNFNPIPFGSLALILGFLSIASQKWDRSRNRLQGSIKILAFFAALYTSFLSGSRGGWIAIPLLLLLVIRLFKLYKLINKRNLGAFLLLGIILTIFFVPIVKERFDYSRIEIQQYQIGDYESSTGHRYQLWEAALFKIYKHNPILGIGKGGFQKELIKQANEGSISKSITRYSNAHSDIFLHLSELGSLGLIALFLLYFGPSTYFWINLNHYDITIKTSAYLGIIFTCGYFIFGLTFPMLEEVRLMGFYTTMVTIFLGIIAARKREIST